VGVGCQIRRELSQEAGRDGYVARIEEVRECQRPGGRFPPNGSGSSGSGGVAWGRWGRCMGDLWCRGWPMVGSWCVASLGLIPRRHILTSPTSELALNKYARVLVVVAYVDQVERRVVKVAKEMELHGPGAWYNLVVDPLSKKVR
jgi:hypothetical protein